MPLDGRLEKMERAAGWGDGPCAECGQSGEAFGGRDREEVLREAAERAAKEPHVVRAEARAFGCRTCKRPRVLVIEHVDNWREGAGA